MERPTFAPMPPETAALLPVWNKAVVQAQDLEGSLSFSCPVVTSQNGSTLLLGLTQERTAAGRALVRALWFDQPVSLWLPDESDWVQLTARAWKCHITGGLFRQALDRFRDVQPGGDLSVVWELLPVKWEETQEEPPVPVSQALLSEAETHLELLRPAKP